MQLSALLRPSALLRQSDVLHFPNSHRLAAVRVSAALCLLAGITAMAAAQTPTPWSYEGRTGPLRWGKLDPAYKACSKGDLQSPIDIRGAHLNTALKPIEFHYLAAGVTVENTGNMIVVHAKPGSYIVADGVRYDLDRLEFHHPSEHAIHGRLTDMDVEMLHKSADGKMAVISVRLNLDRGEANATLATITNHLPEEAGKKVQITDLVNPGGFLPRDRGYWTYMGSLTTPPCTEGVRWFLMEQEVAISREQVRAFQRLFRLSSRPLQDGNGRRIEANE